MIPDKLWVVFEHLDGDWVPNYSCETRDAAEDHESNLKR